MITLSITNLILGVVVLMLVEAIALAAMWHKD